LFRSTVPDPGTQATSLRTAHVDYLLSFVIARSAPPTAGVLARIEALERTLVTLTKQWRSSPALTPVRELRVSAETLDALLKWIEDAGPADRAALERLGVYASGALTDRSVPAGWLRVQLL
jgi:hypothetical protein